MSVMTDAFQIYLTGKEADEEKRVEPRPFHTETRHTAVFLCSKRVKQWNNKCFTQVQNATKYES